MCASCNFNRPLNVENCVEHLSLFSTAIEIGSKRRANNHSLRKNNNKNHLIFDQEVYHRHFVALRFDKILTRRNIKNRKRKLIIYLERLTEVGYFEDFFEDKFDVSQQSLIVADLLD